jgi:hypothetical protein
MLRWAAVSLCIGALAWHAGLGNDGLAALDALLVRPQTFQAPLDRCTTLALDRTSGSTVAVPCPKERLIWLEAAEHRGTVARPA